jgi:hypothetical protein
MTASLATRRSMRVNSHGNKAEVASRASLNPVDMLRRSLDIGSHPREGSIRPTAFICM